jgi:hypothetical protein
MNAAVTMIPINEENIFRDPGEVPVLDWIDKNLIDIDQAYQRGLDEARVQRIVDWFEWRSFGALVVAKAESGRYRCIDGQHRLEAAKRHPKVGVVPAVIIAEVGTGPEAETFVTLNRDRKNVTPLDLYWAQLAANDPEAVTAQQVCQRAGVVVQRYAGATPKPGETVAISVIRNLIDRKGALRARQVLDVVKGCSPIGGDHIRAAELLLTDPEFCNEVDVADLVDSLAAYRNIRDDATAFAETHRMPKWKAMASIWFKRTRKRRKAA